MNKIKIARKAKSLTQKQLAKELNISVYEFRKYEKGMMPNSELLSRLIKILEMPLSFFMCNRIKKFKIIHVCKNKF